MSFRFGRTAASLLLLSAFLTLLLPTGGVAQEPAGADQPVIVGMEHGSDFTPQSVVALANQTVRFSNTDSINHDVTANDFSWNSTGGPGAMGAGAVYERIFTEPGVYDYFCTLHGSEYKNMWGRVIVVAAEPGVVPGGGEHGPSPEEFGVRWLAHWVGIISFVAVIAVLIIYYFVLKYGETVHATDHRDRKEK